VARVISVLPSPNELGHLQSILHTVLDKLAPLRVIRTRLPENMINPKVEKIKKKRDRLYRMYKISQDVHYLNKVRKENKKIKKTITSETKRVFQQKAETSNTKSFWQMVNQMQGKVPSKITTINVNGCPTSCPATLAACFADFFEGKIKKLTKNMPCIRERSKETECMPDFTIKELEDALRYFKTKMSTGPDGLPMRIVKFYAQKRPQVMLTVFNNILKNGFPDCWRIARVTPVPKKGDLKNIENYRPVSNLSSISKLFERCILHRLMALPNYASLLGNHQHGFRPSHSTTSCLLQLKDEICEQLDSKHMVLAYSLDLSAAFDMLRPDTFMELMSERIPRGLLGMLGDFLTDRKFYVEMEKEKSSLKCIDRGCPQGSVLGPVLFNLYTGLIKEKLPKEVMLTSYADDSYVVIHETDQEKLISSAESCIATHIESLEAIGMKVNEAKTEIIIFGKNLPSSKVKVKGVDVETKDSIKALGVQIDKELSWKPHITKLKKRVLSVIGGVRMVRNKLTQAQATKVVTAQVFSILYYACAVWFTPTLGSNLKKTINSLHYRSLRLIIRDYRQKVSRDDVTERTKRLPPDKWSKFVLASLFMNMFATNQPSSLLQKISLNTFTQGRKPGLLYSYDRSLTRIGRQSTRNWLGQALGAISAPWTDRLLTKDTIRIMLKRAFSYNN